MGNPIVGSVNVSREGMVSYWSVVVKSVRVDGYTWLSVVIPCKRCEWSPSGQWWSKGLMVIHGYARLYTVKGVRRCVRVRV